MRGFLGVFSGCFVLCFLFVCLFSGGFFVVVLFCWGGGGGGLLLCCFLFLFLFYFCNGQEIVFDRSVPALHNNPT